MSRLGGASWTDIKKQQVAVVKTVPWDNAPSGGGEGTVAKVNHNA